MIESKSVTNPFPGLRPFETDEYRLFFGREGQSEALITRLQRSRFLAVVGTSGSGKSSLVRAGLLPALRGGMMAGAGSGWRISIMRPGNDPFGNLAQSLAQDDVLPEAGGGLPPAEAEAAIEAQLRSGSLGLVDTAKGARLAEPEKLLVLVDQFEELFRFRAARAATNTGDEASAFVKLLLEAAQQRELSIYVVLTMRSDFLGDCAQFQGLPEAINDGQYLIPRMTRDERRIAIAGPVGVTRGKMAEPLINRLLNDVGDNPDQLPILQHALMRTWDYWAAHRRNGEPIGLEHYEAIGAMSEALSLHADEAWEELPDTHSEIVAEKLFKALTEKGADNREIRRPTRLSEIAAGAEVTEAEVVAVIEVFRREGRSFLMPPVGFELRSDTVIDISHESLIRNWDRLQVWVDEEAESAGIYRRLAENAVLHRAGKEGLLQDPALQIGLDWREKSRPNAAWAERYHPEFAEAMSFLDQSKQAREAYLAAQEKQREEQLARERRELEMARDFAEKQARAVRRMRWLTAGMAVMFLAAIVITVLALRERAKADREFAKARSAETAAKASETTARNLAKDLQTSAVALQKQNDALDVEKIAKETEAKRADDRAKEALAAKKNAESEKAKAEQKTIEAGLATARAVASAEEAQSALARGELIKEGLEASRRQGNGAFEAFRDLTNKLDEALHPAGRTLSNDEVEKFTKQLGWALSHLGSVQRQSGDTGSAEAAYERARAELEKVWPKPSHPNKVPERILFETYDGLGNTYHDIALAGYKDGGRLRTPIDPVAYYKNAEDIFQYALAFQQRRLKSSQDLGIRAWDETYEAANEVAAGHLNLARLYRDMGLFTQTEKHLKELVKVQNEHGGREGKVAASRELAEFYRRQDRLAEAEQAYNDLIATQADSDSVEDYAKFGTDIANSYDELADVYRARAEADKKENQGAMSDKTRKAEYALAAATAIQRFSSRLRRLGSSVRVDDRDDLADAVAGSYFRLGQLDRAARLYEYALDIREQSTGADHAMLWKSYENLRKLYVSYKDRTKEEEHYELSEKYNKLLLEVLNDKPQSTQYADALTQLGNLYSLDSKRYSESEPYYDQALKIYQSAHDWMNENVVLFRLSKLYEKQGRGPEHEQALIKRVDTLAGYFNRLANRTGAPQKDPVQLVYEYIYATNALGFFYAGNAGRTVEAAAAYHKAFLASDYITRNIYNDTFLRFYAAVLADYQKVLNKLENKTEATIVAKRVDDVTKAIQLQLNKLQQSEEITRKQTSQQDQQSQTRAP